MTIASRLLEPPLSTPLRAAGSREGAVLPHTKPEAAAKSGRVAPEETEKGEVSCPRVVTHGRCRLAIASPTATFYSNAYAF